MCGSAGCSDRFDVGVGVAGDVVDSVASVAV